MSCLTYCEGQNGINQTGNTILYNSICILHCYLPTYCTALDGCIGAAVILTFSGKWKLRTTWRDRTQYRYKYR